jgi:phosphohistidine swiveling domain-containing protein
MGGDDVLITQWEQPVLFATLFSEGLRRPSFERATSWEYGVEEHRYEFGRHSMSGPDADRLRQLVAERAQSEAGFWSAYIDRGVAKGEALLDAARSLARLAHQASRPREMLPGFEALAEATREMAPFLAATPAVRARLESFLTRRITEELGPEGTPEKAAELVTGVAAGPVEPEAIREVRDCYRIASKIMDDDRALELLRSTSPELAERGLEDDFPDLYGLIRHHVDDYGWLWTDVDDSGGAPRSTRKLLDRIQAVLLRWDRDTLTEAAQVTAAPTPGPASLSFESLAEPAGALRDLVTRRPFRGVVHRQAEAMAAPFLAGMAELVGCTAEQVAFSSAEEVRAALADQAELPIAEIDRRIRNSFTVVRSGETLRVHGRESPPPEAESTPAPAAAITGTSACRGRAVGPVRIVHAAPELGELEAGEILVTATSSPEVLGGGSAFPTRTGAPRGLENAAAIVTDDGGFLSHAAIVSREHQIPCIVGTERATTTLVDGQVVEVDATSRVGRVVPVSRGT